MIASTRPQLAGIKAWAAGLVTGLIMAAAGVALAQHAGHTGHGTKTAGEKAPASIAFAAINDKMHQAMSIQFTGDADVDFVKGMIPHHQGAVDMAQVLLKYGKDPVLQKLATEIVAAQEAEIALMKAWLAKKGG
jgi:uncharacterized protein (DUF305 family)